MDRRQGERRCSGTRPGARRGRRGELSHGAVPVVRVSDGDHDLASGSARGHIPGSRRPPWGAIPIPSIHFTSEADRKAFPALGITPGF